MAVPVIPGLRRFFRLPLSEQTVDRDVADEVAFHIQTRVEELMTEGHQADEARELALREFGDVHAARDELSALDRRVLRRRRRWGALDALRQDAAYAVRLARRHPGFALAVIVTLGLAIGANAAMFGITDRLLLRPPEHIVDAERVRRVFFRQTFSWSGEVTQVSTAYADYTALRDGLSGIENAGAWFSTSASLGRGQEAQEVRRVLATGSLFPTLGVQPLLGRFYTDEETAPVVVLSHRFWQRHFGGARDVLGRTLHIGNVTYSVIGVAPRGFTGVDLHPVDVWMSFTAAGPELIGDEWATMTSRNIRWLHVVVRLRPGVEPRAVAEQATTIQARVEPNGFGRDSTARVLFGSLIAARGPVSDSPVHRSAQIALWLTGVCAIVLVIACANVANLLLARATRRRREMAIRLALGIGRGRLALQVLVETLLLAAAGGALALLLAHWGGIAARALLLPDVSWSGSPVDRRVLAVTAALVVLSAVLAALTPALSALRGSIAGLVKTGGRDGTYTRSPVRTTLVIVQAMLCVVLLVGAGLFTRSLHNVRGLDLGFDAERVLVLTWDAGSVDMPRSERLLLYEHAQERVRALPQVEDAAVALTVPFHSSISKNLRVKGVDSIPIGEDGGPYYNSVTPEFFRTLGTRIVRGRGFTAQDVVGSPRVAIVSETMARLVWRDADAIGQCMYMSERAPCTTVVGIAQDARRQSIEDKTVLQFYLPLAQEQTSDGLRALLIRLRGDDRTAALAVRRAVQSLAPSLPNPDIRQLQELIDPQIRPWRLGASMFTAFGVLALLLAVVGLYSVISFDVAQRTQEIGVRMALGARAANVLTLILSAAGRVVLAGVILGLAGAWLAGQRLATLLFQVSPHDPAILAGVSLLLLGVGLIAALVPAARAVRVAPITALRVD